MSPSEVPPEVLAIAVALAVELAVAERAGALPAEPPSRWRWAGASHRWS